MKQTKNYMASYSISKTEEKMINKVESKVTNNKSKAMRALIRAGFQHFKTMSQKEREEFCKE